MDRLTRLWNAGIVGRLSLGFLVLVLSCCVLGVIGSTLTTRTASTPAAQPPIAAPATAAPTRTVPTSAAATALPATSPPSAAQPTAASPTSAPQPTAAQATPASQPPTVLATPTEAAPAAGAPLTQPPDLPTATVVEVIDGDTMDVRLDGQVVRLRLIGIDTPEIVDPRQPVQCFGREASVKAHALLDGQTVALEADPTQDDRDRYGRRLRYVWLPDGRLFNLELVAQGYAFEYTYDLPYKYQATFKEAEHAARAAGRGLWSPATCNGERRPAEEPALQPAPSPVLPPAMSSIEPLTQPTAAPAGNCDPSYPDVCIPPPPPDLDCGEIPYRNFHVLPPDPHRFDGDRDGIGCER